MPLTIRNGSKDHHYNIFAGNRFLGTLRDHPRKQLQTVWDRNGKFLGSAPSHRTDDGIAILKNHVPAIYLEA